MIDHRIADALAVLEDEGFPFSERIELAADVLRGDAILTPTPAGDATASPPPASPAEIRALVNAVDAMRSQWAASGDRERTDLWRAVSAAIELVWQLHERREP